MLHRSAVPPATLADLIAGGLLDGAQARVLASVASSGRGVLVTGADATARWPLVRAISALSPHRVLLLPVGSRTSVERAIRDAFDCIALGGMTAAAGAALLAHAECGLQAVLGEDAPTGEAAPTSEGALLRLALKAGTARDLRRVVRAFGAVVRLGRPNERRGVVAVEFPAWDDRRGIVAFPAA